MPTIKNKTLESIKEKNEIEYAIKENIITKVYNNKFIKMVKDNIILVENEKYQQLLKILENAFPGKCIKDNPIPLLLEYCGNDFTVGVEQNCYLKELYDQTDKKIYFTQN